MIHARVPQVSGERWADEAETMRSKSMLIVLRSCLLGLVAYASGVHVNVQSQSSLEPPMPFEDIGACPFEGCTYRDWIANAPVAVRVGRRSDAPVAFTLEKGDHAQAITGVVVTLEPGRVQFRTTADLTSNAGIVRIQPGETLYLLTYHGEGVTTAWFKGRLYDELDGSEFINAVCEFRPGTCNGTIIEKPQTVWWVRLRNRNRVTGWTDETQKFDNKDRFGYAVRVGSVADVRRRYE
jgi:hypothetical protein